MRERRLAFGTTASTALKTVPSERSGVSSALVQAIQKTGPNLGAAILGSVLGTAYQSQLHLDGPADKPAEAVQQSVSSGVAVAMKLHLASLLESVREAGHPRDGHSPGGFGDDCRRGGADGACLYARPGTGN